MEKGRDNIKTLPITINKMRRYHVDIMPVRGLVRSKIWFSFKIGAINSKRVLKMAAEMAATLYNKIKFNFAFTKSGKYQVELLIIA
ncbi:hypothetical protein Q2T46_07290 [Thermoanaerobacterium sp. CMT5567-10]|uniref:hypothetical protein n=1 Tax=Thermoanaerobacterium sp. CMT5567-10 TaxID=3061989 RepID=UPI0026DF95EC|nr:hypothetical protein [Thermoanaerobacterium sp. CMT5567-10]WKV10228.1 hypothetical protein Q2T46_07290 [Thermoanaerobacterium sp. CMT5567-10]